MVSSCPLRTELSSTRHVTVQNINCLSVQGWVRSDLAWSSASVYGICRPSPCDDLTFGIRRLHVRSVVDKYQPYSHLRATSSQPLLTTWSRSATSDHASQRSVDAPQPRPACTNQSMLGTSSVCLCHQPMAGSADSFSHRQSLEQLTAIERQAQP